MLEEAVEDYHFNENMLVKELVLQMEKAWGFSAGKLASGVEILEQMVKDASCVKFLSFPANLVATGVRGVFKELVEQRMVDAIVTTCGTLDHDLARSWKKYYKGFFTLNDKTLRKRGINRLGNILIPNESYGEIIEEKMSRLLQDLWAEGVKEITPSQLCREIGKRICSRSSILFWAAKRNIPVYVPGITDGAVGYQLWLFSQQHPLKIDTLKDEGGLNDTVFSAKKTGALIVGGGISKHHTLWWNQFKDGLNYAVYISTAVEWDGSLSGAKPSEAISWHKIRERAKHVMIEGDASIILPIMMSTLITRCSMKNLKIGKRDNK